MSDSWEFEGKAIGWESVTVPVGSFHALRVDYSIRRSGGKGSQRGSYWYAPDIKGWVKMATQLKGKSSTSELQSYTLRRD